MSAGADTTTPLACAILVALLKHPSTMRKLTAEIDNALASGHLDRTRVANWAAIEKLPFFMACVYEAARLYPPVPILLPYAAPSSGFRLPDGRFVPGGTAVGATAAVINRNDHIFGPDADDWCPERWLGNCSRVTRMHRTLLTWGWGTRRCIGKQLALIQCCKMVLQVSNDCCQVIET